MKQAGDQERFLLRTDGDYPPLVGNFTNPTETITYRIVFTPSASASQSDARALAAAVASRPPALVRMSGKLSVSRPGV